MIKSRRALEKEFDSLYAHAERILKKHNPCQHKVNNGKHSCVGKHTMQNHPACCCMNCKHWVKDKGCGANQPLTCKVWICPVAGRMNPAVDKKLYALTIKVDRAGFNVFRGDKNASINQALAIQKQQNQHLTSNLNRI